MIILISKYIIDYYGDSSTNQELQVIDTIKLVSKSLTTFVFTFGLWSVLRASLCSLAGHCWCHQHSLGCTGTGASTGCWLAPDQGADRQPPAAAALLLNPVISLYIFCSYSNVVFVGNRSCSRHWTGYTEAAYQAQAGIQVNQAIITQIYLPITSFGCFICLSAF